MISVAALEEAVLVLLVYSKENAPTLALKLRPNLFTTRTNQKIAETALDYIKKYNTPPGGQISYLLENEMQRGDEGKLLAQTVDMLKEQEPQIQPSFILEQLDKFIRIQSLARNLQQAMESLHVGELEQAEKLIYQSSAPAALSTEGIWLRDTTKVFSALDKTIDDFYPCGIPTFDNMGISLAKKTLTFIIAPKKKGKTWWLTNIGKSNLQHHHSVLHITLELSEDKQALRYLQSIFSLSKYEVADFKAAFFDTKEDGSFSINFRDIKRDSVLNKRREIQKQLSQMKSFPPLLIKEFPTGTLTTEYLKLYLDSLKKEKRFDPDVIIIDYADLMQLDREQLRIDTGRQYVDLRGISVIENAVVVTASQGNRESDKAKIVDAANAAEDWSKLGTADLVFTYSQTAEERKIGLARMLVAAGRDVPDRVMALISQNYNVGQFCLDSVFMQANVAAELVKINGD